ncbi:pectin acetylesterase-family hydrolase [Desertimonas flava]|uniref:pectin acetylesterase-family hydrolase n=1 Tax=Desertimonas flava TaxID=2064846 RepID=UPI0013C401D3|nr:pectin acetylesterase-family hydrolase [Desertimonas flava]
MRGTKARGLVAVAAVTIGLLGAASTMAGASSDPAPEWTEIVPGGDCQCADGADFSFFAREADPTKVMFFLEGGGACFDPVTCAFTSDPSTTYDWDIGDDDDPATMGGIFDFDHPGNPFADYSVVYVPYCTGDIHLGNTTHEFSPELSVQFKGAVNGAAAVEYLAGNFADAEQVVVVGESAGSAAAPLYSGLISDAMDSPRITVFADGSGAYPDEPALNAAVGGLWGTMNAVPDWEGTEDMTVEEWSLPGLWVQAGTHDPDIVMARFDFAYDATQSFFAGLVGVPADDLLSFIDANEATVEAAGVEQWSYTAPGSDHTLVRNDAFYEMEVEGVTLVDWVSALVAGEEIADVHCEECEPPAPAGSDPADDGAAAGTDVTSSTG